MSGKLDLMRHDKRGTSTVEMALVLMLLLLLIAGVVDVGRAFNNYIIVTNASREGARYAARFPHYKTGIIAATKAEAVGSGVPPESITVSIDAPSEDAGASISVTAAYNLTTIMGGILGFADIPMQATTKMVIFGVGD